MVPQFSRLTIGNRLLSCAIPAKLYGNVRFVFGCFATNALVMSIGFPTLDYVEQAICFAPGLVNCPSNII